MAERPFNRVLSSGRQVVERCIGHLKGRFRRLREIPVHKPEDIVSIIVSGCILHNLCIIHKDDVENFIEEDGNGHPNNYPNLFRNDVNGINRRLQIMAGLPYVYLMKQSLSNAGTDSCIHTITLNFTIKNNNKIMNIVYVFIFQNYNKTTNNIYVFITIKKYVS